MPPTINAPLRILLLCPASTQCPTLLRDISHHEIRTPYYDASIPIWRDELPTTSEAIASWKTEWMAPEAGEVIQAVGAWIVCFRKPRAKDDLASPSAQTFLLPRKSTDYDHDLLQDSIRDTLTAIRATIEHHSTSSCSISEPLLLTIGMPQTLSPSLDVPTEEWEHLCRECGGWEWIDGASDKEPADGETERRNEFGEKVGVARLREALEANEWEGEGEGEEEVDEKLGLGDVDGFGEEVGEIEREMRGLRRAVKDWGDGDGKGEEMEGGDEEVLGLEAMMLKMQAVRDMGGDMPEAERRNFAARAVRDVMKSM